ncbi:MAG: hypothetical protein KDD78_17275 [Caldilineaceae bacterium]|nr:hypothetical protein [Caldilineaceae bacterium]
MTNKSTTGGWNLSAIASDMATAGRLLFNPQVPTALKVLLPMAALVYWISPIDLLPGLPFDDIALMVLALRMFVQLAPDAAKSGMHSAAGDSGRSAETNYDGDVVDTTWSVVDD